MEKRVITLLLALTFYTGFAQYASLSFKKEQLNKALLLTDITPENPGQWNMKYVSVDIVASCNGSEVTASGTSDLLTEEQLRVVSSADLGTDIVINVNYNYSRVSYYLTVMPDVEAEFPGGKTELTQYLNKIILDKITDETPVQFYLSLIKFTVNEEGEIGNAQLTQSSGDQYLDRLLLEAVNNMPKWTPAQNAKGQKVKQEYRLGTGRGSNKGC
ncbi:MAG: energy transducer TonB [Bacteroidota bacterium]